MDLDAKERINEFIDPSSGVQDDMDRMYRNNSQMRSSATRDQVKAMREFYATGQTVQEVRIRATGKDYIKKNGEFKKVTEKDNFTLVDEDRGVTYIRDTDGDFKEVEE